MPGDTTPNEPLIIPFRHGPFVNVSYLVACIATGRAMVIDPAWDVPGIVDAIRQRELTLEHIVVTHAHSDHTNGVADLVDATGALVSVHDEEAGDLRKDYKGAIDTSTATFEIGAHEVRIHHTPGHSPGSMVISVASHLFSGDTLSVGAPGRPGFKEDSPSALYWSTALIRESFDAATIIHPGHDAGPTLTSSLGHERENNPALAAVDYAQFLLALERLTGRDLPPERFPLSAPPNDWRPPNNEQRGTHRP